MYFPTSPSAVGNPSEFAICSEKEQINVLKQIKILHDKLNDVVELVNYCFSVQVRLPSWQFCPISLATRTRSSLLSA